MKTLISLILLIPVLLSIPSVSHAEEDVEVCGALSYEESRWFPESKKYNRNGYAFKITDEQYVVEVDPAALSPDQFEYLEDILNSKKPKACVYGSRTGGYSASAQIIEVYEVSRNPRKEPVEFDDTWTPR